MNLKTLYHKGKKSTLYSWRVWTEGADILTEYGQVGGQMQIARKTAVGKNSGKANVTSDAAQAEKEALAMWTFKVERKYSETPEAADVPLYLPMLADKFEKRLKFIKFPVDVQRKYDGTRALASWVGDRVRLLSRGGKEYHLPHIQKQLESFLPKDTVLDGEMYIEGVPFQTVVSWIKRLQPDTEKINYCVYDCPEFNGQDKPWIERVADLKAVVGLAGSDCPNIVLAETFSANSAEEVFSLQREFVQDGYEGAIVRLLDGVYEYGYRSKSLLKQKSFDDGEFPVAGYEVGVGRFSGVPIWICTTPEGNEFRVTPKGTMEARAEMLVNAASYMGKQLTVRYFGTSTDNIPRFPVGVGFRLEEDQ